MVDIGKSVIHALVPVSGKVIGYGTILNPWNNRPEAVVLVAVDNPVEVPSGKTSISVQAFRPQFLEEQV